MPRGVVLIAHNKPTLGTDEANAATKVLQSGWVAPGPEVEQFEQEFCQFVGLPSGHAVAVSSGTAALFLALNQLNVAQHFVDTPVYACSALRNAILMANAKPHYLDNIQGSFQANHPESTTAKASIIQHSYGFVAPLVKNQHPIIEDCAQALGSTLNNQHVGLLGNLAIFSFYATKMITTGGHGGMVVSKDKALIASIKDYLAFDCRFDEKPRFNFQMTDLQAAIGRVQLQKLPTFIERRAEIYEKYQQHLPMIDKDISQSKSADNVRYRALLPTTNVNEFIEKMSQRGIRCINPLQSNELQSADVNAFEHALTVTSNTVSLPIYPSLTNEQVDSVISAVQGIL